MPESHPSHSPEISPEKAKPGELLAQYVETHILSVPQSPEEVTLGDQFSYLTPREKTDRLYEKLMAYNQASRIIAQEKNDNPGKDVEPVDPYLVSEIRGLWEDPTVQELAKSRYSEARLDRNLYRLSELGSKWHTINSEITRTQKAYEEETRKLFLQQVTRPDQVSATKGKTEQHARKLLQLEGERKAIVNLENLPKVAENTNVAAHIMYEQLRTYHEQAVEGFVWLPSREAIHLQTIASLQNARWPVLIGEAGTGKSEQADAAAFALTGEQPTHIACNEKTSVRELIADKAIDSESGGSYEEYGPVMQAATGYHDSQQTSHDVETGRIVRLDESGRMGSQGYAVIKELRQKKTASKQDRERFENGETIDADKLLHGKPVLPGFSSIWTTNPVGARYPDRTEPDAALRRELSYIPVDYPPMTVENPELFEFMLATLMDEKGHIPAAMVELAPLHRELSVYQDFEPETLPDGREIEAKYEIVADPTNPQHGALYRLAFAVRSLQDAFNFGNTTQIPETALRYTIDNDGKTEIVSNGGDLLTLSTSTITLGEVASWMKGFHERQLKDNPEYQVGSLTEWIQVKLKTYLDQVDSEDREKIRAIFEHYHLFDQAPDLKDAKPITPKEIGYLSPRVPQPMKVKEVVKETHQEEARESTSAKSQELYQDIEVMDEEGRTILVKPIPITINPRSQS